MQARNFTIGNFQVVCGPEYTWSVEGLYSSAPIVRRLIQFPGMADWWQEVERSERELILGLLHVVPLVIQPEEESSNDF